ncbi:MAG: ABC transporter permease [Prevotella sp.]|nr:ABC transporter permease [Prevotella sp.]
MGTTDISYIGLAVGLLLMAAPIWFFRMFGVRQIRSTLIAVGRMVVQLFLIGLYLRYLFEWNSPWINILWVLLMVVVASLTASHRTRLRRRVVLLPLMAGLLGAALVVGLYFLVFVLRLPHPFDARYFIPIMGILMGNMLGVCVMGLNTFYDGLQRERQLYYYLLGNGATHLEAVMPFVRRAIERSFAPCIANMAVMGIVSLPGTMIGQILGGSAPGIAIKYQMMIIVITFSASMLALMTTLHLADRRSFDVHGRLRDVRTGK